MYAENDKSFQKNLRTSLQIMRSVKISLICFLTCQKLSKIILLVFGVYLLILLPIKYEKLNFFIDSEFDLQGK